MPFETVMKWQPGQYTTKPDPIERIPLSGPRMLRDAPIGHPTSGKMRSCESDPPKHQHSVMIVSQNMGRWCEGHYDLREQKWYSQIHGLAEIEGRTLFDAEWCGAQ